MKYSFSVNTVEIVPHFQECSSQLCTITAAQLWGSLQQVKKQQPSNSQSAVQVHVL